MAISLGTTSEHLLRGIDRMVASFASVLPARVGPRGSRIPRAWASDRGGDILVTQVEVLGGFPGNLRWQHRIANTTLHLTETYLIVGEGTSHGFALPLIKLAGTAVQNIGGLKPPTLTIWYQDGDLTGSFSITFLGTARGRAGLFRAEVWQQHLTAAGIYQVDTDTAKFAPNIHLDWDDIAGFVQDDVICSGPAIASVGGWFGSELDTSEFWLTERSLIWCAAHGEGVNRLALDRIIDCRNGFGDRLAIGIEDACGGRYDIFFDFGHGKHRDNPGARMHQRLAAIGVPVGTLSPVTAPWRRGGTRRPSDI